MHCRGLRLVRLVLQGALRERIVHSGAQHRETGIFHNNLGVALFGLGRHDDA